VLENGHAPAGSAVEVVRVDGGRVLVRALPIEEVAS
jgi:hypothetical protein